VNWKELVGRLCNQFWGIISALALQKLKNSTKLSGCIETYPLEHFPPYEKTQHREVFCLHKRVDVY
jgi:hypothetical protein